MRLAKLLLFNAGLLFGLLFFAAVPAQAGNIASEQCLSCHAKVKETYTQSAHAKNSCTSCHTNIDEEHMKSFGSTPAPSESKTAAGESCQTCHATEIREIQAGVHDEAGLSCNSCHGNDIHGILPGNNPKSMVYTQNLSSTCGACHGGEILTTYQESFHGRAVSLGSTKAADCADCHGTHAILGSSDPGSKVAKANVPATCGSCHVEPLANYAAGTEHKPMAPAGPGAVNYWTFKFFVWLTILTVIGLVLHMEMELFQMFRAARRKS